METAKNVDERKASMSEEKKHRMSGKDLSKAEMIVIASWLFGASVAKGFDCFSLSIKEIVIVGFAVLGVFAPITFSIWLDKVIDFMKKK